jgi:hypothetical protein
MHTDLNMTKYRIKDYRLKMGKKIGQLREKKFMSGNILLT